MVGCFCFIHSPKKKKLGTSDKYLFHYKIQLGVRCFVVGPQIAGLRAVTDKNTAGDPLGWIEHIDS